MKGFVTADAAQEAFYEAFGTGNAAALETVWSDSGDCLCIHPAGEALLGPSAIHASWRAILGGGGAGQVSFETLSRSGSPALVIFTGYEHITPTGSRVSYPPVLATNAYRLTTDGWQMVLHHASPIAQQRPEPVPAPGVTRH